MARNATTSRHQPVTDRRRLRHSDVRGIPEQTILVRRGGHIRRVPNPLRIPLRYYAFISRVDGPSGGPWLVEFECIERGWVHTTMGWTIPGHYNIDRLRTVLDGRDYDTAWESSIGARVVLRHIYQAWLDELCDDTRPPRLAVFRVRLYVSDLRRFNLHDPAEGNGHPLTPGWWHALEIQRLTGVSIDIDVGELQREAQGSSELERPVPARVCALENLRLRPYRPGRAPLFSLYSQAELQALHHTRAD